MTPPGQEAPTFVTAKVFLQQSIQTLARDGICRGSDRTMDTGVLEPNQIFLSALISLLFFVVEIDLCQLESTASDTQYRFSQAPTQTQWHHFNQARASLRESSSSAYKYKLYKKSGS